MMQTERKTRLRALRKILGIMETQAGSEVLR